MPFQLRDQGLGQLRCWWSHPDSMIRPRRRMASLRNASAIPACASKLTSGRYGR
ncbi:hypothetical protein ACFQV4_28965 [Streptomyces thermocarboxydus]